MKRLPVAAVVLTSFCFITALFAQDGTYFRTQGEVMDCAPPKFMLVSEIDMKTKTLTGMSTVERNNPKPVISAFHLTFKHSDIKVTNARGTEIDETDLPKLKGELVVLHDGRGQLSAAYLGLFRKETFVVSVKPSTK